MLNQNRIKQKVLGQSKSFGLVSWADRFMFEYGMDFEGFKKLNIQAFYLLRDAMEQRYKEQNRQEKSSSRKR